MPNSSTSISFKNFAYAISKIVEILLLLAIAAAVYYKKGFDHIKRTIAALLGLQFIFHLGFIRTNLPPNVVSMLVRL